jgi:hypothetical protein
MQTEPAFVAVPKHAGQVAHTVQVIAAGQCKQHMQQRISISLCSIALTYSKLATHNADTLVVSNIA